MGEYNRFSTQGERKKVKKIKNTADWIKECVDFGVSPAVENMNISDRGIFYMYGEEPAVIEALFMNGTSIKVYVGEGLSIFANIYDSDGCPARNSKELKLIEIPTIEVLPQISAVLDAEKVIKKATTRLSSCFGFCRGTVTRTQDPLVPNQMR